VIYNIENKKLRVSRVIFCFYIFYIMIHRRSIFSNDGGEPEKLIRD